MANITVTRGLAELKTLDARINQAIAGGTFVGAVRGNKEIPLNSAVTKDQILAAIEASFTQVDALIERRDAIKRAIIVSNGQTVVDISGQKMTVAEAIERKGSIGYTQSFINTLVAHYNQATQAVNQQNTRVEADIEKRVMAAYGNDKGKVTDDQYNLIAQAVKGESAAKLLDPKGIADKIKQLQTEFSNFVTEVDFVLSESNARTEIHVPD